MGGTVVITHPDGTESVEEIDQATELIERSVRLMNNLRTTWRNRLKTGSGSDSPNPR
jgi:hypothetical protein